MPSIGHIAVGMAAGQGIRPSHRDRWLWMAWFVVLSCVADLDLVLSVFGRSHNTVWGHRGFTHSVLFALVAGGASVAVARRLGRGPTAAALLGFGVYASHLLLDCLNVGSVGVPWLWPLTSEFYSLPWAPIPAVLTAADFLTVRGLPVLLAEVLLFAPCWLYALFGGPVAPRPASAGTGGPLLRWGSRRRVKGTVE